MNKNIPNAISISRMILCIVLLFLPAMEPLFITIYIIAFLTDVLDGNLARLTHTTSELGKKLDSIGDLLFFIMMALKVIPWMFEQMERWQCWLVIVVMVVVLVARFLSAYRCKRLTGSFTPIHSIPNKIVALLIFAIPFLFMAFGVYAIYVMCVITMYAAIDEVIKVQRHAEANRIDKVNAA